MSEVVATKDKKKGIDSALLKVSRAPIRPPTFSVETRRRERPPGLSGA